MFFEIATFAIVSVIFLHNIASEFMLRVVDNKLREHQAQFDEVIYDLDQIDMHLQDLATRSRLMKRYDWISYRSPHRGGSANPVSPSVGFSPMTTLSRRLGRRKSHAHSRRVPLRRFLHKLKLVYPNVADWIQGLKDWGMLGNDQAGDCTAADVLHHIMALIHAATGNWISFTTDEAFALYTYVTGQEGCPYDPSTGNCDTGCVMSDVLQAWQAGAVPGHTIEGFVTVNPEDTQAVKYAVATFGGVDAGVDLPVNAMDQNSAGKPWTIQRGGNGIIGGHAVPILGYDEEYFYAITWGGVQAIDPAWLARFGEEILVPVSKDFLNSSGVDPNGIDLNHLENDLALLGNVA